MQYVANNDDPALDLLNLAGLFFVYRYIMRKKITDYIQYPTSVVDGKKIVGTIEKVPYTYPGTDRIMGYKEQITVKKSLVDTSLSKDVSKHKQKSVRQYDPGVLNARSRVHTKKHGSKYTLVLNTDCIYLELSQLGDNLDSEVRIMKIGTISNGCFIPSDRIVFADRGYTIGRDIYWVARFVGVSLKTLLNQCKAIALQHKPHIEKERYDNTHHNNKIRKLIKSVAKK